MKNIIIILILILMISTLHLLKAQSTDTVCSKGSGINDNNSLLTIFPNPSEGTFQIVYASTTTCPPAGWGGMMTINIMNSNYKTVYSETILDFEGEYNQAIDLSTLEKGVYTVEITIGKTMKVIREVLK